MLQVKNLTLHHLGDLKEIIKDLSFTINPGEKVAIIGEEGNGKSTLLKWILRDKSIESYIQAEGELINQFSRTVYLPQSLPQKYLECTVDQYFFGQEDVMDIDYQKLYQLVGQLGFDADRLTSSQQVGSLSGGEKIKVQLLKALSTDPDLLLLDEPSNDLDLDTVKWLEHFIKTTPLTIIFISHDEALLTATATKVIQIELLQHKTLPVATVSNLPYKAYIEQKEARYEHQSQVGNKQREEHQKQMEKYRQVESSVHHAQGAISRQDPAGARLLKKKMHAVKSMGRRFEREKENFEEIPLKADAILVKFSNTKPLPANKVILHLEDERVKLGDEILAHSLNLLVRTPQKIGIIGQNGVGKSTLLKKMWAELSQRTDIVAGYMPQNYADYLRMDETPVEFLSVTGDSEERTQVMTYLGSMRFTTDEMHHAIQSLSGGQQAKLLLLKIDLAGQNVLLLDEPTRNFSPLSQPELRTLFKNFAGSIITISHDRMFLKEVCDYVYELKKDGFVRVEME
ncbi:ATP-binding cassette domain-containing protein [Carnobacterium pleistocenium]|uniref:ATP-binding cassette domain-containing protein n=1 Tax=Carnobacterium pleistocenium TaxID=181073 RepID=UPI0005592692|nr:ATP-binding cassette domain-containing protein [Carnobacterium pleistocenium]